MTSAPPSRGVARTLDVVPLTAVAAGEWAAFVEGSDECWLYHHPAFLEHDPAHSRSFAVLDDGRVAGGCILYVNRSGFGKVLGGRLGAAGLALSPAVARRAYPLVSEYLLETARASGCHAIQMGLPRLAPAYETAGYLDSPLAHLGFTDTLRWGTLTHHTPSYTSIVDLSLPADRIWADFSKSVRQKCKLASSVVTSCDFQQADVSEDAWQAFERNHDATMRRGGAQSLPAPLLARLRSLLGGGHAALLSVRSGEEIIASLLLLTYKQGAFYFASGLQAAAFDRGFAAQLHWLAIQELQRRGYRRYEIGQFFPALSSTKIKQLGEFKRMFGGTKRRVLFGELITNEARFLGLDLLPAYGRQWLARRRRARTS